MKLLITLQEYSSRRALNRMVRVCREHKVKVSGPVWMDNEHCELEIYAGHLSERLLSELSEICADETVEDASIQAA